MYEGKPLVLVVGSTDTGRTPIAAALLRRAFGPHVVVQTAGVLSHAGEGAMPEAQLAVEQIGLDISRHVARPLHHEEHGQAELLLALDRGTELVLVTEFPNDPRIACLSALAELPDVLDPHRMPLGIWIAAMRQIDDQIRAALPILRQRLGIAAAEPLPDVAHTIERQPQAAPPLGLDDNQPATWNTDEHMQRLMSLINVAAQPVAEDAVIARNGATDTHEQPAAEPEPIAAPVAAVSEHTPPTDSTDSEPIAAPSRAEQVARMVRILDVAAELPEIIDWQRLRQSLVERLRALSQQPAGTLDFTPAAVLMIEGKLAQQPALPNADALDLLRQAIARLEQPLATDGLAAIGGTLAQW